MKQLHINKLLNKIYISPTVILIFVFDGLDDEVIFVPFGLVTNERFELLEPVFDELYAATQ